MSLRTVTVMRYILPLREGGSLPALAEADDEFKYVLKFRGSGHGVKMLISELLGGKIAEALGLKLPELVFANLDVDFGRTEGDEEIQDLLKQQSEEEKARIASLVKIYEGMKPKDAARIFNTLDTDILLDVVGKMSERKSLGLFC